MPEERLEDPRRPLDPRQPAEASVAEPRPPALADRGVVLFGLFTVSALAITAIVVLVGAIARWWILIPVMAVDFAVTAAVLVTVASCSTTPAPDERRSLRWLSTGRPRAAGRPRQPLEMRGADRLQALLPFRREAEVRVVAVLG
jgi:hypothetical protein